MIFSGVGAATLLPLGIVFLLATPGTQPVAAVAAAFMIAFGAAAAIIFLITAVNLFKYRQKPLDASHMSAISSLIKEREAISNNQATPDHHNHSEQTPSSEFDCYRESRSLLDPRSGDQSHIEGSRLRMRESLHYKQIRTIVRKILLSGKESSNHTVVFLEALLKIDLLENFMFLSILIVSKIP